MGSAFLHGQGGGGGMQTASGTFTLTSFLASYTIQLNTDFIPDKILLMPIASTSSYNLCSIICMKYDRATDTWVIIFKRSSSNGAIYFYTQDTYVSDPYGAGFVYDAAAGTIAVTGSSSSYPPFDANVTYEWTMWKE